MGVKKMSKILVITPVKNSVELTEKTIRAVMNSVDKQHMRYVVYDDFSDDETAWRLDALSVELDFEVVHLSDLIDSPSPNYRYVLQKAQERAVAAGEHLVVVESDVVVNKDTFVKLEEAVGEGVGLVASVTVDEGGVVNFPYLFARKWGNEDKVTKKRISFCCTLLTNEFLKSYDFHNLDSSKNWYDVFISHKSVELGFKNIILMSDKVLHRPHSSRPWKLLKYTNPLKYYWIKYTKGFDKI
jgi:glycosyltransferase involved in cell wall biosynthesis